MEKVFQIERFVPYSADWRLLMGLQERWPEEISISDITVITCRSERARAVIEALFESPENEQVEEPEVQNEIPVETDSPQTLPIGQIKRECAECGSEFETSDARVKYCSKRCRDRHGMQAYQSRKKAGEETGAEPEIRENLWLDELSGEFLNVQEINKGLREGRYPVGRRFRRSRNREYVVEEVQRPGLKARLQLMRKI